MWHSWRANWWNDKCFKRKDPDTSTREAKDGKYRTYKQGMQGKSEMYVWFKSQAGRNNEAENTSGEIVGNVIETDTPQKMDWIGQKCCLVLSVK